MSRIAVFFANGFEEIEALTVVDLCRRAGIDTEMVSATGQRQVTGAHKIIITADKLFEEVNFDALDMIVLPGGMPGTKNLEAHPGLMEQLDRFYAEGKYVSAICAAPSVLGHRGILKGRRACCYPGFEEHLDGAEVSFDNVCVSGNVITSRGMGTAISFALAIIGSLIGQQEASDLAASIVYGGNQFK